MSDKPEALRLEFEAYFASSRKSKGQGRRPNFALLPDGTYADDHAQRHWWTWQQAIVSATKGLHAECERLRALVADVDANARRAWADGSLSADAWPVALATRITNELAARKGEA